MLFVSFFKWWYSDGLSQRARMMRTRLEGVIDYFSIDLLLRTLFQPFRQDSSGHVDGSLDVKLHAMADNLISRCLGAVIRTVILIFGLIAIVVYALIACLALVVWVLVPLAPAVGAIMTVVGVTF